jgi:hypothetical protein
MKQTVIQINNEDTGDPLQTGYFRIGSVEAGMTIRLPIDEIPEIIKHLEQINAKKTNRKAFTSEIECYYRKLSEVVINNEIRKAFETAAQKVATQVIEQYDLTQMIQHEVHGLDNRIVITTVFERKNDEY